MTSPLITGNDLRSMSDTTKKILTNKEMIAINQDPLGIQVLKWIDDGDVEIFIKPMDKGEYAVLFLNRADVEKTYVHDWAFNEMKDDISKHQIDFAKESFNFKNVWTGATGDTKSKLNLTIPAHDVVVLRLTPKK
jgi:alpha-galactosidase